LNTGVRGMETRPVGGASDVFVVAFDDFGNVRWAKQFGTVQEDALARGGGVECDNEGNVIVVGNTRGGLQRFRSDEPPGDRRGGRGLQGQAQALPQSPGGRMASDVFVMSLSRADGAHVNAPFVGGDVALGVSGGKDATSSTGSATVDPIRKSGGGMSPLAKAGISLVVMGIAAALSILVVRGLGRRSRKRHAANERMWENDGGDNFGYDHRGGRSSGPRVRGPLRGVGGTNGDDDWDDGTERISRNATWMDNDDDGSVHSIGSSSSKGSKEENSAFLASLRQEAASTMTKMVKNNDLGGKSNATSDPRLDGGASIKSLLTHYREVKKDTLLYSDTDENSSTKVDNDGKSKKGRSGKKKGKGKRLNPPPPPPPRRKKKDQAEVAANTEPDGLSDFTIV